jgi:hypothetical protein
LDQKQQVDFMKKIYSFILIILLFLFSFPANASPFSIYNMQPPSDDISLGSVGKISPLQKDQKAPFDGVLLDPTAAAKIIVSQEQAEEKCKIEIEKEVAIAKATSELDLANIKASREALQKELDTRILLKDEHIEFLENEAVKNAKKADNGKWWLVGGIATGILLTIGGAFIVREINSGQPIIVNY